MSKYLDENGLLYLWTKIKAWVSGQGYITSSDIPEGAAASGVTPIMDGTAAKGTDNGFARGDHVHPTDTSRQAAITSSSKLSADLISDGTTNKVYTATEKTKLSNIASGAEVNVVKSVDTTAGTSGVNLSLSSAGALDVTISSGSVANGNSNFVTGGTVYSTTSLLAPKESPTFTGTPAAPTANAGTNTTQIATTAFVTTAVANGIAGITGISYSVVSSLPASGQAGVIYLISNSGSGTNSYDEYIWLGSSFEKIGTTDVDLSGYMQISAAMSNSDMDTATNNWA